MKTRKKNVRITCFDEINVEIGNYTYTEVISSNGDDDIKTCENNDGSIVFKFIGVATIKLPNMAEYRLTTFNIHGVGDCKITFKGALGCEQVVKDILVGTTRGSLTLNGDAFWKKLKAIIPQNAIKNNLECSNNAKIIVV